MDAGAHRVGDDALEALCEILETEANIIAKKAIANAAHANRKTIDGKDIKLAVQQ